MGDRFLEHMERAASRLSDSQHEDIEVTDDLKRMVMANCNVRGVLESWGVRPVLSGGQWNGYCPDHILHDGHPQHLPKWSMSAETGDCTCFTSAKHSNFIYIAKRMYGLDTVEETVMALTNSDRIVLPPPDFIIDSDTQSLSDQSEEKRISDLEKGCAMMKRIMARGHLSDKCLEYFANDGITKDTLDFLGVCSVETGFFEGRAMIPFIGKDREICGYVAVNYMGRDWWVKKAYDKARRLDDKVTIESVEKSYKKTMYCPGFRSRDHMYGLYEVLNGQTGLERLVVVEGERDAMKLLQEGIDCVSIHGTSLKAEQRRMLKKLNPKRLYLGFDMDKAGCVATGKAYDMLDGEVERMYVLNFPDGKDPKRFCGSELDSLIRNAEANSYSNFLEREIIAKGE